LPLNTSSAGFIRDFIAFGKLVKTNQLSPSTVIAGDNYFGFLIPYLYRLISRTKYNIQISIHNSLKPLLKNGSSLKTILKHVLLRKVVSLADSIRTVSSENRKYLTETWNLPDAKIVVAPIPLVIPDMDIQMPDTDSVGFLGRIHPERGLESWVRIIQNYFIDHQTGGIAIAGDGDLRENFLFNLSRILPESQIKSFGNLPSNQLDTFWKICSVLLSTAEEESYGMAIREAVLNGRKVVAKLNAGTIEVQRIFPRAILLFRNEEEASLRLEEAFEEKLTALEVHKYRLLQQEENKRSLKNLAQSWL
jgi:glycosyltransferase involved in cell wall biosynthesis